MAVVDENVSLLHDEVTALRRSIARVDRAMREPLLKKDADLTLWQAIDNSMLLCQATIESLNRRVQDVTSFDDRQCLVGPGALQMRLNYRADEFSRLRFQIQSHQSEMQIILQAVSVHIISSAPNFDSEELHRQLHILLGLVTEDCTSTVGQDIGSERIRRAHKKLQASAKAVASKASAVLSSGSEEWSETQAGQSSNRSTTTGSELGKSLTAEQRRRISSWVACNPDRDSSIPPVPQHPLLPPVRQFVTSNNSKMSSDDLSGSESRMSYLSEVSDDDELEVEVAYKYFDEGRRYAGNRDYATAEALYRKCLDKAIRLGKKCEDLKTEDVRLDIAVACYEQDKLADAMNLTDALSRQAAADDRDRRRVLTASHLKALILLRQGSTSAALRQCKQTLKSQRRLAGKDTAYHESIALMATIFDIQGDHIEARTYSSLLPAGFRRPKFKPPSLSVQPVDMMKDKSPKRASAVTGHMVRELNRSLTAQSGQTLAAMVEESPVEHTSVSSASSKPSSLLTSSSVTGSPPSTDSMSRTSVDSESLRYQQMPLPLPPSKSVKRAGWWPGTPPLSSVNENSEAQAESRVRHPAEMRLFPAATAGHGLQNPDIVTRPRPQCSQSTSQSSLGTLRTIKSVDAQTSHQTSADRLAQAPELTPGAKQAAQKLLAGNGLQLTKPRDWRDQLFWAAQHGHHNLLHMLLTDWQYHKPSRLGGLKPKEIIYHKRVHVDTADNQKRTALHLAAMNGHTKAVGTLLDLGASCTERMEVAAPLEGAPGNAPQAGQTALECAFARGHHATAEVFLSRDCIESIDRHGWSSLHQAAWTCDQAMFTTLLTGGMDPEWRTTAGRTPLHVAAQKGCVEIIGLLLRRNVDVDARDNQGNTPLCLAVSGGHLLCVKMLQGAGADIRTANTEGDNLLHIAVRKGHDHLLTYLIFKGADMEGCDALGRSPLHCAAAFNKPQALRTLISLGANVSAVDEEGNTALHAGAEAGHVEMVEAMHAQGLSVSQPNRMGRTPLHLAAMGGHRAVVMELITQSGGDVRHMDRSGMTAMRYAMSKGHRQVVALLGLNGAGG